VLKFTSNSAHAAAASTGAAGERLAPVREALSSEGASAPAPKQEAWGPRLRSVLQEAELETRAILAQAKISLRELVSLTPGDVIPSKRRSTSPCWRVRFRCIEAALASHRDANAMKNHPWRNRMSVADPKNGAVARAHSTIWAPAPPLAQAAKSI